MTNDYQKRLSRILGQQQNVRTALIQKQVALIAQHPEILDKDFRRSMVLTWQREAAKAREFIVKQTLSLAEQCGDLCEAVDQMVKLSRSYQLSSPMQTLVPVANTRYHSCRNIHGKINIDHLDRDLLHRWIKAFKDNPSQLVPPNHRTHSVPEWASPLIEVINKKEVPSLHAAIRELHRRGFSCDRDVARRFIRRMVEEIDQIVANKGK